MDTFNETPEIASDAANVLRMRPEDVRTIHIRSESPRRFTARTAKTRFTRSGGGIGMSQLAIWQRPEGRHVCLLEYVEVVRGVVDEVDALSAWLNRQAEQRSSARRRT